MIVVSIRTDIEKPIYADGRSAVQGTGWGHADRSSSEGFNGFLDHQVPTVAGSHLVEHGGSDRIRVGESNVRIGVIISLSVPENGCAGLKWQLRRITRVQSFETEPLLGRDGKIGVPNDLVLVENRGRRECTVSNRYAG